MRNSVKIFSLILSLILCLSFAGCGKNKNPEMIESTSSAESSVPAAPVVDNNTKTEINPLTGLKTLEKDEVGFKPLAVSVNNVKVAQQIQAGIDSADVVFETITEAGITRLLALFKAPTAEIGNIGSIRSARVVFAELAASMNAVYVHHGQDETYFVPRAKELNLPRITINTKTNGERIQNGKNYEHTLYTSGEKLRNEVVSKGYNTGNESAPWLKFSENRTAASDSAKNVTVKFNSASVSNFTYDETTQSYVRGAHGKDLENYFTKNKASFTNVFVLYTSISLYPDKYHSKVALTGGEGYYITKCGYEKITWSKTGDFSPIEFKAEDGSELSVSTGKSYICIADKDSATFTAE